MNNYKIRFNHPFRTHPRKQKNYRKYKSHLRKDFFCSCGYCGDLDHFLGGSNIYHIDHFAPKSKFPDLENKYSNLVYSCPFCNNAKNNDWIGKDPKISFDSKKGTGYIDPCDNDYEAHLERNGKGEIIGKTKIGKYMVNKLNLELPRHSIIWKLTLLKKTIDELKQKKDKLPNNTGLIEEYNNMLEQYQEYEDYLWSID
jgi:uncharacterized protein (TIGR02646 family)